MYINIIGAILMLLAGLGLMFALYLEDNPPPKKPKMLRKRAKKAKK